MKRKILMLALLTAVFALLLCVGAGAYDSLSGKLLVNDTDIITAANNTVQCGEGTAVYDSSTQTLTLTDATITVPDEPNVSSYCQSAISVGSNLNLDLNIVLVGQNKIITNNTLSNGIYVAGGNNSLTISGEGSLSITCNNGKCGIYSASNGGDIIIDGVKLDIHSEGNNGIGIQTTSGSVSLQNGADVSCTCGKESIYAFGGSLTIENSSVHATSTAASSRAIASSQDLDITNSTVNCSSVGVTLYTSSGDINISGSTVSASAEQENVIAPGYGYGIYITDNSNVTVEKSNQTNSSGYSFSAIEADIIHICDSSLSSVTYADYLNIFAWYELKIANSTVEAYNNSDKGYISIYCEYGPISIEDSEVYAESKGNYAICSWQDKVTISNGVVTALSNSSTGWESIAVSKTVDIDGSWVVTDNGYFSSATYYYNSVSFKGSTGQAYGDAVLPGDVTLPEDYVLVLREGESLIIPAGVTLTNYGTIQVLGGSFTNNGTYIDYGKTIGEIKGNGSFPNNWFVTVKSGNGAADVVYRVVKGEGFTLPEAPQNSGYIFLGWSSGDATYSAGDKVDITSDTTFTAVWGNLPDVKPSEPETPETPVFPFYDVTARDWYYDAVAYVYGKGLMDGVDVGVFAPNGTLTRAMVWTIIARAEGVDTTGGATWYAKAQEWVTAKGISDGENPNAAITRQELVTMLYRLAGEPAVSGTITAPDAASVSSWATDAMTWAMNIGLVEGDENGAVTPTATATRAQAAALIMRYLES